MTKVVVGCVTIEGTAVIRETVGKLVIALGESGLFVEPFVSTTTTSDGARSQLRRLRRTLPQVFSGRFDDLGAEVGQGELPVNLRSASGTVLIGTVALLLIAVLGWLLLIGPATGNISDTHAENDAAVASNQLLTSQVAALKRQAEELPQMRRTASELSRSSRPRPTNPASSSPSTRQRTAPGSHRARSPR